MNRLKKILIERETRQRMKYLNYEIHRLTYEIMTLIAEIEEWEDRCDERLNTLINSEYEYLIILKNMRSKAITEWAEKKR